MTPLQTTWTTVLAALVFMASPGTGQEIQDDLLAGPTVQDEEVTLEDMRAERSRVTGKGNKTHQSKAQSRIWLKTFQSLELSEEQQTNVQTLMRELRVAQEAFQKEYGKEIRELKKKSKEAKQAGDDIPDDVGTRTRALMALAPDQAVYQARAWKLLTEEQQASFQEKYQAALEELKKRLEERKEKNGGDPMLDEGNQRNRFTSDEAPFREYKENIEEGSLNDADLGRAKFLRRLRRLQKQ
ncbi:MAG: hypothetical protein QGI78_04210 [Phycisphaerales bacterium]|nr:hypothetical protein [Phycisphaerales bacterium]